jgi:phosphomannomutase
MNFRETLFYIPVELSFGTSGLRGLIADMTDLECYINTRGFIAFLEQHHNLFKPCKIALAGDLRDSTPRLLSAVNKGIIDSGYTPDWCGFIPTPALTLYGLRRHIPSIMVTGSHIPADRNGIKFNRADGEIMKTDENNIKACVATIREQLYTSAPHEVSFDVNGMSNKLRKLNEANTYARDEYMERYQSVFSPDMLDGKHIVVYQHSAVGRDMLVEILAALGARVTAVQRSDIFIPIDTENITPEDRDNFQSIAKEFPDNFAIVSTDGDSDRPFLIDELGMFHRGDVLGLVCAQELQSDTVTIPITASDALDEVLTNNGVSYTKTKIGSPYVINVMQQAAKTSQRATGWEVNGGFMTAQSITYKNGTLEALPTRDAFLPLLTTLSQATTKKCAVSTLFEAFPARFTQAGLIDNFSQGISQKVISLLSENSKTSKSLLEKIFNKSLGFNDVRAIDTTDGVRLTFNNRDVVHIRPSGNAPQLRIYATADSQARADAIVANGIKKPIGFLHQLKSFVC